jgi:hypothetical protein
VGVVNPLLDLVDNSVDALRQPRRIDAIRMAGLAEVRVLVRERLEELEQQLVLRAPGAMSSTAFDNLQPFTESIQVLTLQSPHECLTFVGFFWPTPPPDPVAEEQRLLRRMLRLLNKVITIVLRRASFDNTLRQLVLRQRAFFITHGNHPPRLSFRYQATPGSCAA